MFEPILKALCAIGKITPRLLYETNADKVPRKILLWYSLFNIIWCCLFVYAIIADTRDLFFVYTVVYILVVMLTRKENYDTENNEEDHINISNKLTTEDVQNINANHVLEQAANINDETLLVLVSNEETERIVDNYIYYRTFIRDCCNDKNELFLKLKDIKDKNDDDSNTLRGEIFWKIKNIDCSIERCNGILVDIAKTKFFQNIVDEYLETYCHK